MKSVIAKYPIKIGNVLISKGTKGETCDVIPIKIKNDFPNIEFKEGSSQILVKFPFVDECIVHIDQIKIV